MMAAIVAGVGRTADDAVVLCKPVAVLAVDTGRIEMIPKPL
jgi:hypothetical protein